MIWEKLNKLQHNIEELLDVNLVQYEEEELKKFDYGGWTNLTWQSAKFRRAHIDVVDVRDSKKLWMMHVCIFPNLKIDAPIYGFDVIAGQRKITGAFHDFSVVGKEHSALNKFKEISESTTWKNERTLPDWAREIFSENMIAAGNIQSELEVDMLCDLVYDSTKWYIEDMDTTTDQNFNATDIHNRYAYYQKQNPHTPRTMKSLGLNDADVDHFVSKCLFPEV